MEKRTTASELFDAIYGLRTFLVEYDEALIQAALALLTRNHMFLVGPTGQGKSTFLTLLSELFDGAAIFRPQLSAFTIPDHLIGPPVLSVNRRADARSASNGNLVVDSEGVRHRANAPRLP